MTDYRPILERDIERVAPPDFGLQQLQRRRDRHDRSRRIRAAAVGLALAAISIAAALRLGGGLRGDGTVPARPGEASKPGIWAVDAETGTTTFVWAPDPLGFPMPHSWGSVIGGPVVSPDRKRIAFTMRDESPSRRSQIYTIDADGTDLTQLTRCRGDFYCGGVGLIGLPYWSPDGANIGFQGGPNSKQNPDDLYAIDKSGGDPHLLVHEPGEEDDFDWSPDGTKVVFDNYTLDTAPRLKVASIAGGAATTLTEHGETPLWSPDGRWIAFYRYRDASIWLIHPDGSGEHALAAGEFPASWSPDGRHVAILQSTELVEPTVTQRTYAIVDVATGAARTIEVRCVESAQLYFEWPS